MTIYTDRSRILTFQRCSRERFLEYHVQNGGISLSKMIISLSTGIAIHDGVTSLLKIPFYYCLKCKKEISYTENYNCDGKVLNINNVDMCVELAIKNYSDEVHTRGLEIGEYEDELFVFNEQKSLIETWIRVYEKFYLHKLLEEYEVLEVEKEIVYPLTEACKECLGEGYLVYLLNDEEKKEVCDKCNGISNIILMSKPDAILRDKSTGGLVVYSLKTSSSWTETNEKQNRYDDQGISELIAVESLMKEEVQAIKMDFLIKGQRQLLSNGDGTKSKLQNSFLVHPYMYDGGFTEDWRVDYTKAKGWRRVNVWEHLSIKEWVDILFERFYENVEGGYDYEGNKKNGLIITPYPYIRDSKDIENWIDAVRFQEIQVHDKLDDLLQLCQSQGVDKLVGARELNKEYRTVLNQYFPQIRKSCFSYGRFCSFVEHCWGSETTKSYLYENRKLHHITEIINIEKKY